MSTQSFDGPYQFCVTLPKIIDSNMITADSYGSRRTRKRANNWNCSRSAIPLLHQHHYGLVLCEKSADDGYDFLYGESGFPYGSEHESLWRSRRSRAVVK